jgi:glycosyltransferase involved in cell wall biosynthesis
MKLSIILPSRNEELLIRDTLKSFCNYLKKKHYDFEILVVINGSTDRTEEIVNIFSNTYKQVKILKSQSGYGHALKKGLREAKGQYLVIYNVDFYDFRLLDLVDINMYGRDLIVGSKRAHWSEDMRPLYRKLIAQFFNLYLKSIHGFKGSDTHGIKLIKRKVVKKILPKCKTNSGIFDTELVIRIQKDGYKIADFPVVVKEIRPSRFKNRFSKTPFDILDLHRALKS